MDRRRFARKAGAACLASALSPFAWGSSEEATSAKTVEILVADPHAHPMHFFASRSPDRTTPSLDTLNKAGVALSAFAAIGDLTYLRGNFPSPFQDTKRQLEQVRRLEESGQLKIVRTATDLAALTERKACWGLMAIEGADALEGKLSYLDAFFAYGVRQITLLHERDNELGFNQRSRADGSLTAFGIETVAKMNALGMLVDVAHAGAKTLQGIAAVTSRPLIDSHTSVLLTAEGEAASRRLRSWQEMEWIAKTGGVVCTWPFAHAAKNVERTTLGHWAEEIALMKSRLGIAHCGLGTDGGGGLPRVIDGWNSIASLPLLIHAMREAGLSQEDIAAFVGGNYLRVLAKCLA
jgi:membrane dipeptidase